MVKDNKEYQDRAKIFAPFDALKGFKEALREKERIIVEKKELTTETMQELAIKISQIKKNDMIKVVYYDKKDGLYLQLEGLVSYVDFELLYLKIVKTKIMFQDIFEIEKI